MAVKRVYVPNDRMGELVEAIAARLGREVVGDGLDSDVTMGPVHTAAARDRAEAMVAEARDAGARVLRPATVREDDAAAGGYLVSPAVVQDPPADARIVIDEQFAPVLPVLGLPATGRRRHPGQRHAFRPLRFGLDGRRRVGRLGVPSAGGRAASSSTTMAWRRWTISPLSAGWKASGLGAELGPEGMADLTRPRVIRGLADPST